MLMTNNEKQAYLQGLQDAMDVSQYQVRGMYDTAGYLGALKEWVTGARIDKPDATRYTLCELQGDSTQ